MFWLKSCPRCQSDLYDNTDIYGSYINCFQCGHYLTADKDALVRSEKPRGKTFSLPYGESVRILIDLAA